MKKLLISLAVFAICTGAFAQSDSLAVPFRINCGDSSAYTDHLGQVWHADTAFSSTGTVSYYRGSSQAIANTSDPELYRYERYGNAAAAFNYTFTVKNGTYVINLLFAENYNGITGAGQRVFDVVVNDSIVLPAFDIYQTAGGIYTAVIKTVTVKVTHGSLVIAFNNAQVQNPVIMGIEILKGTSGIKSGARSGQLMHAPIINGQNSMQGTAFNVLGRQTTGMSNAAGHSQGVYLLNNGIYTKGQVFIK